MTYYPSDQMNFKNSIALVACRNSSLFGKYFTKIHTLKDTTFDEDNIIYLSNALLDFAKESKDINYIKNNNSNKYSMTNTGLIIIVLAILILIGFCL